MRLQFTFGRGGCLLADCLAQAPKTTAAIASGLPFDGKVYQARWSGREIFVPVNLPRKPPRENQSIRASLGDVIYFHEWADAYDQTGFEAIGLFYGPEIVREWRGDAPVNVVGRIDASQFELLESIGERVWRQGGEGIELRLLQA